MGVGVGGARGLELRTTDFVFSRSSPGNSCQAVHKSQMLAFAVVGAFFIVRAFE